MSRGSLGEALRLPLSLGYGLQQDSAAAFSEHFMPWRRPALIVEFTVQSHLKAIPSDLRL